MKGNVEFVLDSGATQHMCNNKSLLTMWTPYNRPSMIRTSTGGKLLAMGEGVIPLYPDNTNLMGKVSLTRVMLVPLLRSNLISVAQLIDKGYRVDIREQEFTITNDKLTIVGNREDHVYLMKGNTLKRNSQRANLTQEGTSGRLEVIKEEPDTVEDVMKLPPTSRDLWIEAMHEELNHFEQENTWHPEVPPPGEKVISTRWTYKIKKNDQGNTQKIRARLVARGYEQEYAHQFDECFAPVIRPNTLRIMLTRAADQNLKVKHIDFDSAFLYGKLLKPIYVYPPKYMQTLKRTDTIYKLNAAIYGLRQASNAWYTRLKSSLQKIGFIPSSSDECLFIHQTPSKQSYIIAHVDDLLIISSQDELIGECVHRLKLEYSIKDLGNIKNYLGMNIIKEENPPRYLISQKDKIAALLEDQKIQNIIGEKTPMLQDFLNEKTCDTSEPITDPKEYQRVLGSLLYLANTSRPDISLSTGILGRYAQSPTTRDWAALMRTLKYLKNTIDYKLPLGRLQGSELITYTDADWGGDPKTKRSTSGTCHFWMGSIIDWSCKRQKSVTLSTSEAEYVAATEGAKQIIHLINLFEEVHLPVQLPIKFMCDNQSAIALASSLKNSAKSKHIRLKQHYIRELITEGTIIMQYCRSQKMIADVFTKPLPNPSFQNIVMTIYHLGYGYEHKDKDQNMNNKH